MIEIPALSVILFLATTLDGDMWHWDPEMWSHMFPIGFPFGMSMMWFYVIFFFGLVIATVIIITILLQRENQNKMV